FRRLRHVSLPGAACVRGVQKLRQAIRSYQGHPPMSRGGCMASDVPDLVGDAVVDRSCRADLVIGCVFQDEARFLREWIEFHRMMGVQRFFLVNDRSSDNYQGVLRPYCDANIVQLFESPCPARWSGRGWNQYQ